MLVSWEDQEGVKNGKRIAKRVAIGTMILGAWLEIERVETDVLLV